MSSNCSNTNDDINLCLINIIIMLMRELIIFFLSIDKKNEFFDKTT